MSIDGIKTTPPGSSTGGVQHVKKASQSLPPAGGKKIFNHFLSRHVRERKYFSGCKCGICPPSAGKLCAQQTAILLSEKPLVFSTVSAMAVLYSGQSLLLLLKLSWVQSAILDCTQVIYKIRLHGARAGWRTQRVAFIEHHAKPCQRSGAVGSSPALPGHQRSP